MTNTTQIRAYIESQGLKLGHVARVLGISSSALHQKLNDESDFKVSEADRLSAMLGLTMEQRDACFFGPGTRIGAKAERRDDRWAVERPGRPCRTTVPASGPAVRPIGAGPGPSSRRRSIIAPLTPSVGSAPAALPGAPQGRRTCWSGSASGAPPTRKPSSIC